MDCCVFVVYASEQILRMKDPWNPCLQYVGPLRRAANLASSVHDLGGEGARVKVRHKPANLAALYLQDAHASVGDEVSAYAKADTPWGMLRDAMPGP